MQIGTKVIVCAAGGVVLSTLGAVLTVYSISHANRVNELKGLMSAAIQQAETVMANVDQLHQRGAFNVERLSSSLKQNGSQDYRASVLYRTVPVVSGWEIRTNRCQGEGLRVLYAFPARICRREIQRISCASSTTHFARSPLAETSTSLRTRNRIH